MLLCVSQGKASVTRSEIEFNGMVVAEKLTPIETRADIGENDHEGRLAAKEHRERKKGTG
jgi:hypothetical protein